MSWFADWLRRIARAAGFVEKPQPEPVTTEKDLGWEEEPTYPDRAKRGQA